MQYFVIALVQGKITKGQKQMKIVHEDIDIPVITQVELDFHGKKYNE